MAVVVCWSASSGRLSTNSDKDWACNATSVTVSDLSARPSSWGPAVTTAQTQDPPHTSVLHSRHCPHSTRSGVYASVGRPSVRTSVCPSVAPRQQSRCCRFAAVGLAGRRYRLIALCCTACECRPCHVVTVRNNNNSSHDNVYGALIMTEVIVRVHPVHLMNCLLYTSPSPRD